MLAVYFAVSAHDRFTDGAERRTKTMDDKDQTWMRWDRSEIRRLASREAELLQQLGLTLGALSPTKVPLVPPWERDPDTRPQSAAEMTARTAAMFTGKGGMGVSPFIGSYHEVKTTNKGRLLGPQAAICKSVFGSSNEIVPDRRKIYDGKEFEESKRGGYAHLRYNVEKTNTGTPRDISEHRGLLAKYGPRNANASTYPLDERQVVDRRKIYNGKHDQGKLIGQYGPGWYDCRMTNKGTAAAVQTAHMVEPPQSERLGLAGVGFGRSVGTSAHTLWRQPRRAGFKLSRRHLLQGFRAWWTTSRARPTSVGPTR